MVGIVGWLAFLALVMLLERFIKNFQVREPLDPWAEIRNLTPDEYAAYIQYHLEHERIVNGFVLTRAIFPIEANRVRIREGYEIKKGTDENGDIFFRITAAVSAEKIWQLMMTFLTSISDRCQIQVLDFEVEENARVFVADHQDVHRAAEILTRFKDMILNNGQMNVIVHRMDFTQSMHLGYHKHFYFETDKAEPIVELLHSFDIYEDKRFWPFYKSWTINLNEWAGTGQVEIMMNMFDHLQVFPWPLEKETAHDSHTV